MNATFVKVCELIYELQWLDRGESNRQIAKKDTQRDREREIGNRQGRLRKRRGSPRDQSSEFGVSEEDEVGEVRCNQFRVWVVFEDEDGGRERER